MPALFQEALHSKCLSPCWSCTAVPAPAMALPSSAGTATSHMCYLEWKRMRWEGLTESAPVPSVSETLLRLFSCCLQLLITVLAYHSAGRHFGPE